MPAGEVRASDITDLPARHQVVQGSECLLYRGICVETVHMINVDMIRVQSSQARLARLYQMETGRTDGVTALRAEVESRLRGDQEAIPQSVDRLSQDSSERPLE